MEGGASAPLLTKNPYRPSRPRSRNNTLQNRRRPILRASPRLCVSFFFLSAFEGRGFNRDINISQQVGASAPESTEPPSKLHPIPPHLLCYNVVRRQTQ